MPRDRWHCEAKSITHTPFNGPFSRTTQVSRYQKGKPIWILLKQETVSGSGISWAICKSAPRSRQITTPVPHHSVFTGRMPFLPPSQQRQSTEAESIGGCKNFAGLGVARSRNPTLKCCSHIRCALMRRAVLRDALLHER